MVFLPNLCVMQKNNDRNIKYMPALIFLHALILAQKPHFWTNTN